MGSYEDNLRLFKELKKERTKNKKIISKKQLKLEHELIESNLGLVKHITGIFIKKYSSHIKRRTIKYNDLINEGVLGLYRALNEYNPRKINPNTKKPYSLSTLAYYYITDQIKTYLSESIGIIIIPEYLKYKRKEKISDKTKESFKEALNINKTLLSLDEPIPDELIPRNFNEEQENLEEITFGDIITNSNQENFEHEEPIIEKEINLKIKYLLKHLSPKQRKVIQLRYGLGNYEERTLEEIGEKFDVTRERIRQIEATSFKILIRQSKIRSKESKEIRI